MTDGWVSWLELIYPIRYLEMLWILSSLTMSIQPINSSPLALVSSSATSATASVRQTFAAFKQQAPSLLRNPIVSVAKSADVANHIRKDVDPN